eukprot:4160788-Amphidinium_carterae.4
MLLSSRTSPSLLLASLCCWLNGLMGGTDCDLGIPSTIGIGPVRGAALRERPASIERNCAMLLAY